MLFTVSKDEWEDTSKSMKNELYVQRYAQRYLSHQSNIKQWKNQAQFECIGVCLIFKFCSKQAWGLSFI